MGPPYTHAWFFGDNRRLELGSAIPASNGCCQMLPTGEIGRANLTSIPLLVCRDGTIKRSE